MKLWDHQQKASEFKQTHPFVFNTSDPGTGKTISCIDAIIKGPKIKTLILAPKSILKASWAADFDRFAPHISYSVATANNRLQAFTADAEVVITNHDAVNWLLDNLKIMAQFKGGRLIVDESTAFKNYRSGRSQALDALLPYFEYRIPMSGTPTPMGIKDIWHQVFIADRGQRLGTSYWRFLNTTHTLVPRGAFSEHVEVPGMREAVLDLISDITLRFSRDDCMDLPPNQQTFLTFDLPKQQLELYKQMKKRAVAETNTGVISAVNAASLITKLLQIASGAAYDQMRQTHVVNKARNELVADLVEERDHSVIAFNWTHQRDGLIEEFKKRKITFALIDGTVSDKNRTKAVEEFQAKQLQAILLHPQAAGHGLTLTAGATTIWVSPLPTVNAEHFIQLNARIDRGGQTRKTQTIMVCANDTVEKAKYDALLKKVENVKDVLELMI